MYIFVLVFSLLCPLRARKINDVEQSILRPTRDAHADEEVAPRGNVVAPSGARSPPCKGALEHLDKMLFGERGNLSGADEVHLALHVFKHLDGHALSICKEASHHVAQDLHARDLHRPPFRELREEIFGDKARHPHRRVRLARSCLAVKQHGTEPTAGRRLDKITARRLIHLLDVDNI
jgi:hypothetical protein